jgi:hypothetical protein
VIIGAFLKDIFPNTNGTLDVGVDVRALIAGSFVCFGLALVCAAVAMYSHSNALRILDEAWGQIGRSRPGPVARAHSELSYWMAQLPAPLFSVGVICFGLAVLINLYR